MGYLSGWPPTPAFRYEACSRVLSPWGTPPRSLQLSSRVPRSIAGFSRRGIPQVVPSVLEQPKEYSPQSGVARQGPRSQFCMSFEEFQRILTVSRVSESFGEFRQSFGESQQSFGAISWKLIPELPRNFAETPRNFAVVVGVRRMFAFQLVAQRSSLAER